MSRIPLLAVGALCLILSCHKSSPSDNTNAQPAPGDVRASFSIDITNPGRTIPLDFAGLSFETSALPNTSYFNDSNNH